MEWIVRRLYARGKLIGNAHLLAAQEVRGSVGIMEARDPERHRLVRVATLSTLARNVELPPPLHDVILAGTVGTLWSLVGMERVVDGHLGGECVFGQTWLLRPAPDEDLIRLTAEWSRMVVLLREHGIDPEIKDRRYPD